MPQATRTQVVKPLSGEQGVQDELASLLKDDDAEQEDKEKTGNSIVAEDEAATPTTSGPSLTPPGGAAEVIPKSPVGLRSKSLKFPRSALLGLWELIRCKMWPSQDGDTSMPGYPCPKNHI